jgi:CheY-like chemotaxis protein
VHNQQLISFHLRKTGALVKIADHGEMAVQMMTADSTVDGPLVNPLPFDLILSDIPMPCMDGLTSTQLLRSKGYDIPILALTAHAMTTDAKKCLLASALSRLWFRVAGVARLQCVEEKPNSGESGYHCQP